jgi:hypothetical protein
MSEYIDEETEDNGTGLGYHYGHRADGTTHVTAFNRNTNQRMSYDVNEDGDLLGNGHDVDQNTDKTNTWPTGGYDSNGDYYEDPGYDNNAQGQDSGPTDYGSWGGG